MPYTEMGNTEVKLSLIAKHASRNKTMQFTSLAHLLDVDFLKWCFFNLKRNKAKGHDNVGWYDYVERVDENIEALVERLKRKSFSPIPARRVYIPKGDGKFRPLGISAMENKIVEKALATILGAIYEQDFLDNSYGFRPHRNCHQALKELNDLIMFKPVNHIVEADIKGFFDNVDRDLLLDALKIRIKDSTILSLITKFLKAGYIDDRLIVRSDTGTPQGSILSPLLANVFLHYILDVWFEQTVKQHVKGFCEIVRYADDFVCVVQYAEDAKQIEKALENRFNRYKLEIHPEKSRRFTFGRYEKKNADQQDRKANTFDFLGFTHFCDKTRQGRYKLGRKTARKKFIPKAKEMNKWLKDNRNLTKTKDWWKILKAKMRGHFQYYGVSGNYQSIDAFYSSTIKMVHKWLNRRSQKRKMSWIKFNEYLEHYPLPKPSIKHNFYTGYPSSVR